MTKRVDTEYSKPLIDIRVESLERLGNDKAASARQRRALDDDRIHPHHLLRVGPGQRGEKEEKEKCSAGESHRKAGQRALRSRSASSGGSRRTASRKVTPDISER